MAPVSRTIGSLHFEDLDPHRFEDLVRQLIYDFRQWSALEPTGRSGSDDGFDARGWELVPSEAGGSENEPRDADEETESDDTMIDAARMWRIRCKRQKEIGAGKL